MTAVPGKTFPSIKLKFLGKLTNGATPSSSDIDNWDGDIVWVTPDDLGRLNGRFISGTRRKITQEGYNSSGTTLVPGGSLILSTRAPIGHLGILEVDACFNQGCKGFSPNESLNSEFVYYWLFSRKSELQNLGQGTTFVELSRHSLANFTIRAPAVDLQRKIVRYLNNRCRKIDDLIAKKRDLLTLLAEKRSALVTRAVTKGLDPDATMKPSGVSWLGDIPAHWEVRRMRFLCELNRSKQPNDLEDADLVSFVPMTAIGENNEFDPSDHKALSDIGGSYTSFKEDDVLVAKITPCFENGKGAIARGLMNHFAYGTTEVFVLSASPKIMTDYLYLLTKSKAYRDQGEAIMTGAGGQKRISSDFVKDFVSPLPPLEEQKEIISELKAFESEFKKSEKLTRNAIRKLAEYQSAIISQAVTGELEIE